MDNSKNSFWATIRSYVKDFMSRINVNYDGETGRLSIEVIPVRVYCVEETRQITE